MSSLSPLTIAVLFCLIASGGYLAAQTARWVFKTFPATFSPKETLQTNNTVKHSLTELESDLEFQTSLTTSIKAIDIFHKVMAIRSDADTKHIQLHLENQKVIKLNFSAEDIQKERNTIREFIEVIMSKGISFDEAVMVIYQIKSLKPKTHAPEGRELKTSQIA